jgi:sarcosine oxidase subunit gamma
MAEAGLIARSPLEGIAREGRHGMRGGPPGATLQERAGLQIASLATRKGQAAALAARVREAWGIDLPGTPRRAGDARLTFLWAGPEQWLALAENWPEGEVLEAALRGRLGGLASVAAQGDGRVVLRLGGPRARDLLAKLAAIDLHPRAFRPGDTALTLAAQLGVQLWQLDEAPTYEIAAFRGYAGSLYRAVFAAGEEYGIEVLARG